MKTVMSHIDYLILHHSCSICFMHGRYGGGVIAMLFSQSKVINGSEILDKFTDGDSVYEMVNTWFNTEWFPFAHANSVLECLAIIETKISQQLIKEDIHPNSYIDAVNWHIQEFQDSNTEELWFDAKETIAKRSLKEVLEDWNKPSED